jgi:two-component system, chemotaxis family, chemotaxis protein CheY
MILAFKKISILVVDDTEPMRLLMRSVLESLGVGTIYSAENGRDAFNIFRKENPDLVLLDWNMEPVDGLTVAREIRRNPLSPNRVVPIVMMTGYSARSRVSAARDCGITEFLVKPFSANDLAKRLVHIVEKPRDFIETGDFFGPDRRRRKDPYYQGPSRRSEDGGVFEIDTSMPPHQTNGGQA